MCKDRRRSIQRDGSSFNVGNDIKRPVRTTERYKNIFSCSPGAWSGYFKSVKVVDVIGFFECLVLWILRIYTKKPLLMFPTCSFVYKLLGGVDLFQHPYTFLVFPAWDSYILDWLIHNNLNSWIQVIMMFQFLFM